MATLSHQRAGFMVSVEHAFLLAATEPKGGLKLALRAAPRHVSVPSLIIAATVAAYQGDAARGIALLRQALADATPGARPYVIELLAPLYVMRGCDGDLEELLASAKADEQFASGLMALRAVLAARAGSPEKSRELRAASRHLLAGCRDLLIRGRVLQRLALAAYLTSDFAEAMESALASARSSESAGSYHLAAAAYSVAYNVQHAVVGDTEGALKFASHIVAAARRCGDEAFEIGGLIAQYEIAVEMADEDSLAALRYELRQRAMPIQDRERFAHGVAELLPRGWEGDFVALRAGLIVLEDLGARSKGEHAVILALRSISEAALGELVFARRHSRSALALSDCVGRVAPAAYEARNCRVARVLASAACFLIGDTARGRRALASQAVRGTPESDGVLAILEGGRWQIAAACARGYARLVAAARDLTLNRCKSPLTPSELDVLLLLADGKTALEIAHDTDRSVYTVRAHTRAIIAKFEVHNRVAAIAVARNLHLIS